MSQFTFYAYFVGPFSNLCTKIQIEMLELVMNSMKLSINENQKCYEGHELRYIELKCGLKEIQQRVPAFFVDWSIITCEGVGGVRK